MISYGRAALRISAFVIVTVLTVAVYLPLVTLGWRGHSRLARLYWRILRKALGFRVVVRGTPVAKGPALFVANHAGYFDILVLGSLLPACFVAKSEVAEWPGFGFLAKMARTAFVDRSRGASLRECGQLRTRLDRGEQMILFPEGTSNDGNRVLAFKSALLAVAETPLSGGTAVPVQPVSVAYTGLDGLPMQRAFRPFLAWYGDMTLLDHMVRALGLGIVTVEVVFHPAVRQADFRDRKALTHHCHDVVQRGMALALAGRP